MRHWLSEAKISVEKRRRILKKLMFRGKSAGLLRYLDTEQQTLCPAIEIKPIIWDGMLKLYHHRACEHVNLVQYEIDQISHP